MAIRRPHRSIETFDISLMAVVTKAMGAFLVMMLLLIPSYIAVPEMQTHLSDVEAETRQLEQQAVSLTKQNQDLEQESTQLAAQERQATSEQRQQETQQVVVLQQGNASRPSPNQKQGGYPALLIFFDWAECAPKDIDFYVERADTPSWPEVRAGRQPLPPGVFEYPPEKLKTLVTELADPFSRRGYTDLIVRATARQRLWIVNGVLPDTIYALYAKAPGIAPTCAIGAKVLLTASSSVQSYTALYQSLVPPEQGRHIVVLTRLHWDGKLLTYDGALTEGKKLAQARDQKRLDERLEKQGFHN